MATFIKAGFWEKLCKPCKGYKGWLNLDEFVQSFIPKPKYKVFTAYINQQANQAPYTTIIFENTLGEDVTFEYAGVGIYIVSSLALVNVKTSVSLNLNSEPGIFGFASINIGPLPDYFQISTFNLISQLQSDDMIKDSLLEIRVYN